VANVGTYASSDFIETLIGAQAIESPPPTLSFARPSSRNIRAAPVVCTGELPSHWTRASTLE
jgi:hypothetical protein